MGIKDIRVTLTLSESSKVDQTLNGNKVINFAKVADLIKKGEACIRAISEDEIVIFVVGEVSMFI